MCSKPSLFHCLYFLKTDPENTDYVAEKGATRNFQAVKRMEDEEARLKKEKEEEELNNPMKVQHVVLPVQCFIMALICDSCIAAWGNQSGICIQALENRTKESKQEMDILEKLEELRDLNARHATSK